MFSSNKVKTDIHKKFLQGEKYNRKHSAASAAQELLSVAEVGRDWTARFSCNESNCKKQFAKLTKEKKVNQQNRAAQQLSAKANTTTREVQVLGEVIAVTTTTTAVNTVVVDEEIRESLALAEDMYLENIVDADMSSLDNLES